MTKLESVPQNQSPEILMHQRFLAERADFRETLLAQIKALDLEQNILELETDGYTVLRDVESPQFFSDLRAAVLELTEQRRNNSELAGDRRGLFSYITKNTLTKGGMFEKTVLNPKVNAVMAYLLGDGYVLNTQSATVLTHGTPALFMHTDNAYIPEPYPSWALTATAVWVTEDLDEAQGSTRIVPGSHRFGRSPQPGEADGIAIPIECPAGSVQIWNGATWHGNCGRTAPGERVTVHTSFARMCLRTFSNNDLVSDEVLSRNPELHRLLGRGLPYAMEYDDGSDPQLMANAMRLFARRV